jgi:hypothetical protein
VGEDSAAEVTTDATYVARLRLLLHEVKGKPESAVDKIAPQMFSI